MFRREALCDLASIVDGTGGLWIRLVQSSWKGREWSSDIICLGIDRPLPDRERVYSTITITITQKLSSDKVSEINRVRAIELEYFEAEI